MYLTMYVLKPHLNQCEYNFHIHIHFSGVACPKARYIKKKRPNFRKMPWQLRPSVIITCFTFFAKWNSFPNCYINKILRNKNLDLLTKMNSPGFGSASNFEQLLKGSIVS